MQTFVIYPARKTVFKLDPVLKKCSYNTKGIDPPFKWSTPMITSSRLLDLCSRFPTVYTMIEAETAEEAVAIYELWENQ